MKKMLFLTVFFVGYIHSFFDIEELDRQYEGKLLISPDRSNGLYQLMKDVHDIFTLYNIEYWIQGGTLVGALRHQGLVWWDDDFDINIKESDLNRLLALDPVLQQLGCWIQSTDNPAQFAIVRTLPDNQWHYVVDIFLTKYENGITRYVLHSWKREGQPLYLYDCELYPLKLYQFGELQLWGPQDPHTYLRCGFGENYMEKVVLYNHRLSDQFYCNFNDLPMKFKRPALPSVGLIDRVKQLNLEKTLSNKDF